MFHFNQELVILGKRLITQKRYMKCVEERDNHTLNEVNADLGSTIKLLVDKFDSAFSLFFN